MKSFLIIISCVCWLFPNMSLAELISDEDKSIALVERLTTPNSRPEFEKIISEMYDISDHAMPLLAEKIKDEGEDEKLRSDAIYVLGRMGSKAEKHVVMLIKELKDQKNSMDIRVAAAGALGRIGKPASLAVTTLDQYMYGEDKWLASVSETALKSIGTPDAKAALKLFKERVAAAEFIGPAVPPEEKKKR